MITTANNDPISIQETFFINKDIKHIKQLAKVKYIT